MRTPAALIDSRSAAAAYRGDLADRRDGLPFGVDDGSWITVATLLGHASVADHREAALRGAHELATQLVGEAALARGCALDGSKHVSAPSDVIRLLSEQLEDAGAMRLAQHLLDAYLVAAPDITDHERGLFLAHRARVLWKRGDLDAATQVYGEVDQLGKRTRDVELRLRARIGYFLVAQLRGNYPAVRRLAAAVVRVAEKYGYERLAAIGHHGLVAAAAIARDFNSALVHAWREYEIVRSDADAEVDVLANLSQLLLDAGVAESARAGFTAVIGRRPPIRVLLPAIGGLARACAAAGDRTGASWAAEELTRGTAARTQPYQTASALWECALAFERLGDGGRSAILRDRAIAIANEYGYYEIALRAAEIKSVDSAAPERFADPLAPAAREIARRVSALDSIKLPEHGVLAAAAC